MFISYSKTLTCHLYRPVDFTNYENYLPSNVFYFDGSHTFVNTSTDNEVYPILEGQELLLTSGFSGDPCDSLPPFSEEGDAPVFGVMPDGTWLQCEYGIG